MELDFALVERDPDQIKEAEKEVAAALEEAVKRGPAGEGKNSGEYANARARLLNALQRETQAKILSANCPRVCRKCAVPCEPLCAKVSLFNTSCECFRAGLS